MSDSNEFEMTQLQVDTHTGKEAVPKELVLALDDVFDYPGVDTVALASILLKLANRVVKTYVA